MRVFLAIELPLEQRQALADVRSQWRKTNVKASWVKQENLHLTLRFLGECTQEQIDRFGAELAPHAAACPPLTLQLIGAGAFPNLRKPAVLWAGIQDNTEHLLPLQHAAEEAARHIGLAPDNKNFHPHVTVARIRHRQDFQALREAIEHSEDFQDRSFQATQLTLFKSDLHKSGALYTPLRAYPLKRSAE